MSGWTGLARHLDPESQSWPECNQGLAAG